MSVGKELEIPQDTVKDIRENVILSPSDLYSDEPPLETELHLEQIMLLLKCLKWLWRDRTDFYAAGNLTIYYSLNKRKTEDFRGPDFFVVLDAERKTRKSWLDGLGRTRQVSKCNFRNFIPINSEYRQRF